MGIYTHINSAICSFSTLTLEEGRQSSREREWTGAILRKEGEQATKLYSPISDRQVAFQRQGCQSPRYKSVIHKNSFANDTFLKGPGVHSAVKMDYFFPLVISAQCKTEPSSCQDDA